MHVPGGKSLHHRVFFPFFFGFHTFRTFTFTPIRLFRTIRFLLTGFCIICTTIVRASHSHQVGKVGDLQGGCHVMELPDLLGISWHVVITMTTVPNNRRQIAVIVCQTRQRQKFLQLFAPWGVWPFGGPGEQADHATNLPCLCFDHLTLVHARRMVLRLKNGNDTHRVMMPYDSL